MKTKSLMLASGATMAGVLTFSAPAVAAPIEPFTVEFTIVEGARFGSCAFDVLVQATGKAKTITTPTGKVIGVSANTTAKATNLESGKSVQYSVNGTFISTTDSFGNVTTKATGRNFLTDPVAGVVVTSGNFTFTFDEDGNLVEGLSGTGKIIDVCAALS
jgi:hypothetical protein